MTNKDSVVLVEDDPIALRSMERSLISRGFSVLPASDAKAALSLVDSGGVSAVIADICMPGPSGIDLLKQLRTQGSPIPVVLVTGEDDVQSATDAVNLGALRYLRKPVSADRLSEAVAYAINVSRVSRLQVEARKSSWSELTALSLVPATAADYERAIELVWIAYQPVVSLSRKAIIGYEAFVRTMDAVLPGPAQLFEAASRLGRLRELGLQIRRAISQSAEPLSEAQRLFVNVMPYEVMDDDLLSPNGSLSAIASRVVLDIADRNRLAKLVDLEERTRALSKVGYRFALQDFAISEGDVAPFLAIHPEVVKIDRTLVQGIDRNEVSYNLVSQLLEVAGALGLKAVCMGVETAAEASTLKSLGADLMQGYYFAKPGVSFPEVDPACFDAIA